MMRQIRRQMMHSRRYLLRGAVFLISTLQLPMSSVMGQEDKIRIKLTIAADRPYQIPAEAQFTGKTDVEPSNGLPVVVTVAVGLIVVGYLAELILDIHNRVTTGIIIIDLRD